MPSKNITPIARIYTPDQVAAAQVKADAHRHELREEGKAIGLKIGERYRTIGLLSMGFVVGLMIGGLWVQAAQDRGAYTAAAITNGVLQRTVANPELPRGLNVSAADEYESNAAAAREGCTPEQLRAGRRRCGANAPADER